MATVQQRLLAELFQRLSSRKFLAAAVAAVIAVLADVGIISPSESATIIAHVTPLAYIVVEGALDWANRE